MTPRKTPLGNTRPTMIRGGLKIPYAFLPLVLGPPFVLTLINRNPGYLIAILPLTLWARSVGSNDPNKPRRWWLYVMSGSFIADRCRDGVEKIPPLRSRGGSLIG